MNKQHSLMCLLIIILVGTGVPAILPLPAHGALPSGLVCISSSLTSCPQTSFTFNATSGSTLSVNVVAQNTPATNSFDVSVKADQGILKAPADGTGYTVNPSFAVVAQVCINNVSVMNGCSPTDGPGIVHIVAGSISAISGNITLFTIHYNVGTTTGTPIGYQTGCSSTSTPDGKTCVTLVNPTTSSADPENIETADFTNLTPSANFFATPTAGLAPLTVTFNASLSKPTTGTTNTIVWYYWAFGDGQNANVTTPKTTHTYAHGTYTPTLYVLDSGQKKSEIKVGPTIRARVPDFSILASPSSFTVSQSLVTGGPSKNSTIILNSLDQFSGIITLTVKLNTTISNGPTAVLNQTSVSLSAGQTSLSTLLTLKAAQATPPRGYAANVTATSGSLVHSIFVNFTVVRPDFSIDATPLTVTIPQGGSYGQIQLGIDSLHGFNGTIGLSTRESSLGLFASTNPSTVTVNVSRTRVPSTLAVAVLSGTLPGNYAVTVIGNLTGGFLSHNVNVTIVVPGTDFIVTTSPKSFSIQAGESSNATIILTGINGYSSTASSPSIALRSNSSSTLGIATTPSPGSVSILTPDGFMAATLIIATSASTPAGSYTISVIAKDTTISHSGNITVTVTAPVASVQLGAITLSTTATAPGNRLMMNVTISNTRAGSVSLTVYMTIRSGTGGNLTVDMKTVTLTSTQPQMVTLTWDTSTYKTGAYHVYAGIIGTQTNSINQSASAGSVNLNTQAPTNAGTLESVTPWIAIAEAAVIVLLVAFLALRNRRRTATA